MARQHSERKWLSADDIRIAIPSRIGRPDSLLLLLEAARIPNPQVIGFAAQQLVSVMERCPWVALHAGLIPATSLIQQLRSVAATDSAFSLRLWHGARVPDFYVLGDGSLRHPEDALNLIGILLLIRLSRQSEVGTGINKTQIEQIESFIRGRTRGLAATRSWRIVDALALRAHRLSDLSERLRKLQASLFDDPDWPPAAREVELVHVLATWTSDFLRFREDLLKRRLSSRAQGLIENIDWLADRSAIDEEPPEGGPALLPPLSTTADSLSDDYRAALATQSTRTRNLLFHAEHPEVLLDAQAAAAIELGLKSLKSGKTPDRARAAWILSLLTAATGRMPGLLVRVELTESDDEEPKTSRPVLNLSTGILYLPATTPPNIHRPNRSDARFEHPVDHLPLPLPPAVATAVHEYWRTRPVRRVGEWLQGRDPERLIRDALAQINEVDLHTREPAALRKWMQCQLFERHHDLVGLMVLCGDTFGLSDAPLYYHAPLAQDLIRQYIAVIWPKFQDRRSVKDLAPQSNPATSIADRSGAASVVRTEVVRAGFNVLSGQLNISKSKVLKNLSSTVSYHQAFADYLVRRIALVTTHRPHQSLYQLTRNNFSLTTHFAVLQDKQVDPEHFTRLVSTSEALSRLIGDYLIHLQFLATHPHCSAAACTHLTAVCRGEQALIVYLTEGDGEFGVRLGSLDDWNRSTPSGWDGLKPNFHRAFVLNALRDPPTGKSDHSLTVEVLAQGGHLDAAGHPFDDDSVVSPADLLRPVGNRLSALEQALGLRHIQGFADRFDAPAQAAARDRVMTPPPLGSWSEDLNQHEQTRKRLLHDQEERVKSTLRHVELAAEQWLGKELPLLSPDLARVIRAVIRSDRKAIGDDCRKVIVPDLELIEVQDRIAGLSPGDSVSPSALHVATHNLLSRRIRAAKKRLELRCLDMQSFRLRLGRGLSPFLARNPVAVDQLHVLRNHLLDQVESDPDAMPPPVQVAWHLALYDPSLSDQDVFDIATGRLALVHLPGKPGVLVTEASRQLPAITLVGLAALAAGRFSAEQLRDQSQAIGSPATLGERMADFCPDSLLPTERNRFLDVLLTTVRVAARVEEPGLLRAVADRRGGHEASSQTLIAFHGRTRMAGPAQGNEGKRRAVDPDQPCAHTHPIVSLNLPRDLRLEYRKLLYAVEDPIGFLKGMPRRQQGEGRESRRASSEQIRNALQRCAPLEERAEAGAHPNIVGALGSFAHHLNDRELRGERRLAQSSLHTYLTDIGMPLLEVFGSINLRTLVEEDFEDCYQRVVEIIQSRDSASRARSQLRQFHDHVVRTFGVAEADIPAVAGVIDQAETSETAHSLLSDGSYSATLAWIVAQLDRNDMRAAEHARWRRALLNAAAVLVLMRRGGLRINECIWLRLRDLFQIGNQWFVLVVPSSFRGLKTASARRLVRLDFQRDAVGLRLLGQWIEAERLWRAGGRQGKGLLFTHIDYPTHTLGDNVIRELIQLAFQSSCGIEMVPHELRHLFATDQWTEAITVGLGGAPAIELFRALDRLRLQIGHARLGTTGEYYIHHLQLLKIQRSSGLPSRRSLRPVIAALATGDIATVDKAWQRSTSDHHICRDVEAERVRVAVARQNAPKRGHVDTAPAQINHAMPTPSSKPLALPFIVDSWLRSVRTREEFETVGLGLGFTRAATATALAAIEALSVSPTNYRLLELPTRRSRIGVVPRPRAFNSALDSAMLRSSVPDTAQLLDECLRPALLRQGLLRTPESESARRAVDDLLGLLRTQCRRLELKEDCFQIRQLNSERVLTHSLVWNLTMMVVADSITRAS